MYTDITSLKYLVRKYLLGPVIKSVSWLLYLLSPVLPASLLKLERPIFIIGCSRSGTSVFVEIFGRHRDLANWSEAAQILELDYYDPTIDHLKNETHVSAFDSLRIRLFWGLFTYIKKKKRFVNKHPQNSLRMAYLKAIFPDAIFIHVIRDGRAVVHSNLAKANREGFRKHYPFGNFPKPPRWREYLKFPPIVQYAYQWRDVIEYVREIADTSLSTDDYIEVTYEEFCEAAHETLRKLDAFCALDPAGRDHDDIPSSLTSQNTKWRSSFSSTQLSQVEDIIGEYLVELGYKRGKEML